MIIDFHTHTFPDRIAAKAIPVLAKTAHMIPSADGTCTNLQESMRKAGISVSVVLPIATNPHQTESINRSAVLVNQTYDNIVSFGSVHPAYSDWYDELSRIKDAGLTGIKIHPVYQETDIDDPAFVRIIRRAADLGLAVITHGGDDIGYPGANRCSPLMCRHVVEETGAFTFIIAHMGGWNRWEEACDELLDLPVYLDTAFSFRPIHPDGSGTWNDEVPRLLTPEEMLAMIRRFGSERILFGSDCPWADQNEYVQVINALGLSEKEKQDIFADNAKKILHL